ncbi:hypothetical protein JCM10207_006985 [Rhodosporidiobolus poonsookiae]
MSAPPLPARLAHQLHRAHSLNPAINCFTHLASLPDLERQHAASHARPHTQQRLGGVSVAVKDLFATTGEEGEATGCASRMLQDYRSPFEATVVQRLRQEGALIMGKTNMDEFGMGSANVHSLHGPVLNPSGPSGLAASLAPENSARHRVPGGSSGGSAAAVAAGLCDVALASDTGGSTRLPASYTGTVGFKPSYGLVSRFGMVAYASSLDTVGVVGREVERVGEVADLLSFHDPRDPTSAPPSARTRAAAAHAPLLDLLSSSSSSASQPLRGVRVGVPSDLFPLPPSSPLLAPLGPVRRALTALRSLGADLVPVRLATAPLALSAYYVIASAEASSNLGRYSGVEFGFRAPDAPPPVPSPEEGLEAEAAAPPAAVKSPLFARTRSAGFGKEVRKRVLLGTFALSAEAFDNYFLQAHRVRLLLRRELDSLFRVPSPLSSLSSSSSPSPSSSEVDFLLHPSALSPAPLLSSSLPPSRGKAAQSAYAQDLLSLPASLAGLPALSLPAGRASVEEQGEGKGEGKGEGEGEGEEWPVGVTLVGQWGADRAVCRAARWMEERMGVREEEKARGSLGEGM